jgi:AbrB family looped-hinge helix DNA binding protein
MAIAHSRLTVQGQISVPAEVRRRLGLAAGSVLEWDEDGDQIVVRRSAQYSSEDVHRAAFGKKKPGRRTIKDLKAGIRQHVRERHARG